jgi:hypothetical protein
LDSEGKEQVPLDQFLASISFEKTEDAVQKLR